MFRMSAGADGRLRAFSVTELVADDPVAPRRGDERGNGQRDGDAGGGSGCIRRWQGLDPGLEAEGARGKRARNWWRRRAQAVSAAVRYFVLELAESHLTRPLFGKILRRIKRRTWRPT